MDGSIGMADHADVKAMLLLQKSDSSAADANMNGKVDLGDHGDIKAMLLATKTPTNRSIVTFDFFTGAGVEHVAAYKQVAGMPTVRWVSDPTGWTNFSPGDYSDVEAWDDSDLNMGANATGYNAVQCRFTVDGGINPFAVTNLGVTLVGSSDIVGAPLQFWAWNFDIGSWRQVESSVPMNGSSESTYSVNSTCDCWGKTLDSYVDGSWHMYILFLLNTLDSDLNVDYVKAELAYPGPPSPCSP